MSLKSSDSSFSHSMCHRDNLFESGRQIYLSSMDVLVKKSLIYSGEELRMQYIPLRALLQYWVKTTCMQKKNGLTRSGTRASICAHLHSDTWHIII